MPRSPQTAASERTVAVVAFEGISAFHLSVPCLVFGDDRTEDGVPRFKLLVCADRRGAFPTASGFLIQAAHGLDALRRASLIIVPSWRNVRERPPLALLDALRRAHARGATLVGLCLGAFVLAEAGLLDGLRATTHWRWAAEFARRYPAVKLDPKVLYVDEGNVVTSAGTAAGIDCCLHIMRSRLGAEIANRVARRIVVSPHRAGSQAQFVEAPLPIGRRSDRLSAVLDWAREHLNRNLDIDVLASRAAMSRRSFTRHFRRTTGTTVTKWLNAQRVGVAQRLLETTDLSVERIAASAGFGTALSLRLNFAAVLHVSPLAYRRQFSVVSS